MRGLIIRVAGGLIVLNVALQGAEGFIRQELQRQTLYLEDKTYISTAVAKGPVTGARIILARKDGRPCPNGLTFERTESV